MLRDVCFVARRALVDFDFVVVVVYGIWNFELCVCDVNVYFDLV